jgi:putative flippase GtrA
MSTRVARFIGVGLTATLTDFVIFNLLIVGVDDPSWPRVLLANTTAFACATVVGYLLNSRVTFRASIDQGSFVRYVAVAIVGAAIYDGSLLALMWAFDADSIIALNVVKVAAVALSATWNFCGFAFFAFRTQESAAPAAASREAGL